MSDSAAPSSGIEDWVTNILNGLSSGAGGIVPVPVGAFTNTTSTTAPLAPEVASWTAQLQQSIGGPSDWWESILDTLSGVNNEIDSWLLWGGIGLAIIFLAYAFAVGEGERIGLPAV